jgi:DNA invertase Pin-like site-specific DNA recombinase
MVKAYSYIRFSTPDQRKGDSYERQSAKSRKYCEERNYELVEEFLDDGVSGFRGQHRKKGRLGAFLRLVEQGQIESGSVLLVENLDRFSREVAIESFLTLQNLLKKGIDVVILESNRHLTGKNQNDFDYIQTLLEFSRSHSESLRKQETCGASWRKKKENALNRVITARVPYWLEVVGDGKKIQKEIQVIPERAKVIRKIFELAAAGGGVHVRVVEGESSVLQQGDGAEEEGQADAAAPRWAQQLCDAVDGGIAASVLTSLWGYVEARRSLAD